MSRSRRLAIWAPSALLLSACGGGEAAPAADAVIDTLASGAVHVANGPRGAWEIANSDSWRLEEELRIGEFEGTGPTVFGQIRNVIPNPDGSIWVLDSQAAELRLFGADGEFIRTVGRPGEGPGEFAFNPCAFHAPSDEIWVEDARRRWQRFSVAGELLGQLTSPSNLGCGLRQLTTDGRFFAVNVEEVISPAVRGDSYFVEYTLDPADGLVAVDTFPTPSLPPNPTVTWVAPTGGGMIQSPPFTHRSSFVLGSRPAFYFTRGGGSYRFERHSLDGDTLLVIERQYEPVAVVDSIRDREIRDFQPDGYTALEGFDPGSVARVYPPFWMRG